MKNIFTGILTLVLGLCYGQSADWVEQMQDPMVNFYTVQQSFENYWKEREAEKGKGWKQFKRWEAFMEPRVYPTGERPNPSILAKAYTEMAESTLKNTGQWNPMGPFDGPNLGGIGRINVIAFDPQSTNTVYAGTPAGGLWKSTNGGQSWTTNTDQLTNLGVSAIAIHPTNSQIIYIGTGDRDGGDTYSFGVLKSTDGGQTWQATGLSFPVKNQVRISDLKLNPSNPDVLIATTRSGIFRSDNGGTSWSLVQNGSFDRMEQKPGNPNVIYVSSLGGNASRIYRSKDNGQTWSLLNTPAIPTNNARRIELAVTADDSNYVYALVGASDNGFEGLYRSTNGGDTWSSRSSSPNLLGWSTTGSDNGGQAWYDLALAVNPTDKNELFVGGVNIWKSNNGGNSWSLAAHWYGGGGAPFVHADVHDLIYSPHNDELYAGTDGGIYHDIPNQQSWDELNDGMNITQYYRLGVSATDTSAVIAGAQDNGTHLLNGGVWDRVRGGDGMECAINTEISSVMYSSVYYGNFAKSTNGGNSFNANFNLTPSGSGNWVTPFIIDPKSPDTLYAGFNQVWRSYNGGGNFTAVSPSNLIGGTTNIDQMAIAPNHTEYIYISEGDRLWRSQDRAASFSSVNPPGNAAITYIGVSPKDPEHLYITRSGYSANQKVYESFDGGRNWTNVSHGLPNVPANCVMVDKGIEQGVYVGTDLGVFYRDELTGGWVIFNKNLPNVIVNELETNYINRKMRAATYGRGLWETPLYNDLVAPRARMQVEQNVCIGDPVRLEDLSFYNPDNFEWKIEPAGNHTFLSGSSANSQNPIVSFSKNGIYNISLKVSNRHGEDSITVISALAVGGYPLTFSEDFDSFPHFEKWEAAEGGNGSWLRKEINGDQSFYAPLYKKPVGAIYELISPPVNLENHDSAWLSFRHAYSGRGSNLADSLRIYVSYDCSSNWTRIVSAGENGNNNFITTLPSSSRFVPGSAQWCGNGFANCATVNLSALAGKAGVRLKFEAISNGGNDFYLDDILVQGNPVLAPAAGFASANVACAMDTITFTDQSFGSPSNWEWTFSGPATFSTSARNPNVVFTQPGTYDVKLKVTNALGSDSLLKTAAIVVTPAYLVTANLVYSNNLRCFGDTFAVKVNAQNEGTSPVFTWYVNGQAVAQATDSLRVFTSLNAGDQVFATVQSDLTCAFPKLRYTDTLSAPVSPVANLQLNNSPLWCATDPADTLKASPAGGVFSGNGVVNGLFDPAITGTGNHIITYNYTDSIGCTFVKQFFMAVVAPISFTFDPNPTVCENESGVQLNVGNPAGGLYGGSGIYNNRFYPDSVGVGSHWLTYLYNTPACGTIIDSFQIQVLPRPLKPTIFTTLNTLTASSAVGYQWFDANGSVPGATGKTFSPNTNGKYVVRITDGNGCQNFSDTVQFSIGLNELPFGVSLNVFPNPAISQLTLQIEGGNLPPVRLQLFDIAGRLVENKAVDWNRENQITLNISALSAGIYKLALAGEGVTVQRKIVVQ